MNEFARAYGDECRAAAVARLSRQIASHGSVVIRVVGGDRSGELAARRVPGSCRARSAVPTPARAQRQGCRRGDLWRHARSRPQRACSLCTGGC
jgi:hypothetical protein